MVFNATFNNVTKRIGILYQNKSTLQKTEGLKSPLNYNFVDYM